MKTHRRPAAARKYTYSTQIGRVIHGWLRDRPVTQAERRWLDQACALALEHATFLHGEDAHESHGWTMALVGRAAEQIWAASPGAPTWAAMDVEAAIERWAEHGDERSPRSGPREQFLDTMAWSLAAFVTWLVDKGHLAHDDARALMARLDPYLLRAMRSVMPQTAAHAVN
jgi:hypothetical protein